MKAKTVSSKPKIWKKSIVKKTVGGLCFIPSNKPGKVYSSIVNWLESGAPDQCYVHDTADALSTIGIPLVDCIESYGLYIRIANFLPLKPVTIKVNNSCFSKLERAKPSLVLKTIRPSNTKSHHKMAYS